MRAFGLRTESRAQQLHRPLRRPRAIENRRSVPRLLHVSLFSNANVRAIRRKSVDIVRLIERCDYLTFVVFTETLLDRGLQDFQLSGYVEVSLKDRATIAGGVMVHAKVGFEHAIVHVGDSDAAERSWHIIFSNRGPILFGVRYKPQCKA